MSESELLGLIGRLNDDASIHGILVQLPLPDQIRSNRILEAVSPRKDVDGFHPVNQGLLLSGGTGFQPCTPLGIMRMLDSIGCDLKGKNAVVVGRSNIVGKPVALMLLARHATVTLCHSRTADLGGEVGRADVVVAAVGKAAPSAGVDQARRRGDRRGDQPSAHRKARRRRGIRRGQRARLMDLPGAGGRRTDDDLHAAVQHAVVAQRSLE